MCKNLQDNSSLPHTFLRPGSWALDPELLPGSGSAALPPVPQVKFCIRPLGQPKGISTTKIYKGKPPSFFVRAHGSTMESRRGGTEHNQIINQVVFVATALWRKRQVPHLARFLFILPLYQYQKICGKYFVSLSLHCPILQNPV